MLAITKASLRAVFRSPSAVVFSFAFPLVFIMVFGFLGEGRNSPLRVAMAPGTALHPAIYGEIGASPGLQLVLGEEDAITEDLSRGRIHAIIRMEEHPDSLPAIRLHLTSSEAVDPGQLETLRMTLSAILGKINRQTFPDQPVFAELEEQVRKVPGRVYRTIDFILPGQLGFSLLSAGVFGVAFIFFNLRQTLVLKRFFATPIRRPYILFGEALSRVIFQLTTAILILLIGHYAFQFTLVNGWQTFLELLALSFVGLVVFMGFGFVVSGVAQNESSIPPFANLITLPQFLLAGTFFPIDNFPSWLQPLCRALPLTHLNDAMRLVAFEGARLADCGKQFLILGGWTVVVYALAVKLFRWE